MQAGLWSRDCFWLNYPFGLCCCSNCKWHRTEASATHPLPWSKYHLNTYSSFLTQTSFGSSSVCNISVQGIRNPSWLPGTGHLMVSFNTLLGDLFSWCWGWDWVCIPCFQHAAMSIFKNKEEYIRRCYSDAKDSILCHLQTSKNPNGSTTKAISCFSSFTVSSSVSEQHWVDGCFLTSISLCNITSS